MKVILMSKRKVCVIGVDAGGTKTQAVLVDVQGRVISCGAGGPANPNRVSRGQLYSSLKDAIYGAVGGDDESSRRSVVTICLGVAGSKGNQELIREIVRSFGISKHVVVVSDTVIAFWSAISEPYGVAVIAGTGSCAYGVGLDGQVATVGGWGYLIGDEGSGYFIGRSGIAAAARAYDGRGPETDLVEKVARFFHLETLNQITRALYADPLAESDRRLSDFAPWVVQAAHEGDSVSLGILQCAGRELGLSAVTVAQKVELCDKEFQLGLVGGVFKAGELLIAPLCDFILREAPKAKIITSLNPPVLGAVRLALRGLGQATQITWGLD